MNTFVTLLIEGLTFVLVVVLALSAIRWVEGAIKVRRRLGGQTGETQTGPAPASVMRGTSVRNPFLKWVEASTSLKDVQDRNRLRRDLALAGLDYPTAPVVYVVIRFCLAIGLPVLFLAFQALQPKPMTGVPLIVCALLLCLMGFLAPRYYVMIRSNGRKAQLEAEFPDTLDLMVICVEAGLGLEAAFVRVSQEVKASHPRIAEEFGRVSDEFRAGRGRADALRGMADRADVDAMKSFVALLIQTDSLGTSIGRTLKSYSIEMREHRFLKAEEKAMRIPVLMTVPLVACILPVIVAALLLPPIIDVIRVLIPAMEGRH